MSRRLLAIVEGRSMGELSYDERRDSISFRYDEEWTSLRDSFPLSLSMPMANPLHRDAVVRPFIEGLLPDNDEVLARWGRRHHVSPRNPFRLLEFVGEDCAGAVQFVVPDRAERWDGSKARRKVVWLSEQELSERIQELKDDHSAMRRIGDRGQFSLAGAQPKLGLYWDESNKRWGIPEGATPTTHILKPNVGDFEDYDRNEHFCLRLAKRIGLAAASSKIDTVGGIPVIVVERFDRTWKGRSLFRVHQEDMCQALGISPRSKYQREGGPSAKDIFSLIRDSSGRPRVDELRFLDAMIFNWLIKGTDAHAKNYGFLHAGDHQVRLAPLYDLSSYLPYEKPKEERKVRMAMKIGGEYAWWKIGPRQWETASREWGIERDLVFAHVCLISERLLVGCDDVRREMNAELGKSGKTIDRLVRGIKANSEDALRLFS